MTDSPLNTLLANLEFLAEQGKLKLPEENLRLVLQQEKQLTVDELLLIAELSGHSVSRLLYRRLRPDFSKLKMLIMDCDGVLTDGGMVFTKNGDEIKHFNAKDGQGIKNAQKAGFTTGIISAGISTGIVEKRGEMLGVNHVYVGKRPKIEVLNEWLEKLQLQPEQVAYIGDDLTDIPVMKAVGLSVCPADAVREVRELCDIVLQKEGGKGCVRELVEEHLL